MLSQRQFERYQMSRYSREWRESDWSGVVRYLYLKQMWQDAIKNIGEYWYGITSVPRFQIAWEFPEHIARLVGRPKYFLSRVPCDNALFLKSVPKMTDEEIYPLPR